MNDERRGNDSEVKKPSENSHNSKLNNYSYAKNNPSPNG